MDSSESLGDGEGVWVGVMREEYLALHRSHLEDMVREVVGLDGGEGEGEGDGVGVVGAGVLTGFLEAVYQHQQCAWTIAGPLVLPLGPIDTFMTWYLERTKSSLEDSCRALQPFALRASSCPIFFRVAELLLGKVPPRSGNAAKLRAIVHMLGRAPAHDEGLLGSKFMKLSKQYLAGVATRYGIKVDCSVQELPVRIVAWMNSAYTAALRDLGNPDAALHLLTSSPATLPCPQDYNPTIFTSILKRAITYCIECMGDLPPIPRPPVQPLPEPVTPSLSAFYPIDMMATLATMLASQVPPGHGVAGVFRQYLCYLNTFLVAHGHPPASSHALPTVLDPLLTLLPPLDDCGLVSCFIVVLYRCQQPDVAQDIMAAHCAHVVTSAAVCLHRLWSSHDYTHKPAYTEDSCKPILLVTYHVQTIVTLYRSYSAPSASAQNSPPTTDSFTDSSPSSSLAPSSPSQSSKSPLEKLSEDIYHHCYTAFIPYLHRVAGVYVDMAKKRSIIIENLSLLDPYEDVLEHLSNSKIV